MRLSRFHLHTSKESPADAEIVSHQLMLRAGLIRRLGSGLYTWTPLGLRVLRQVETVVREGMDRGSALELLMPSIQPRELWEETGRWQKFGGQLLKIKDRKQADYVYGPTHEEVITDFARQELRSYKQLPVNFYQIQTKFRDEIRPRFGVMRAREFLMKDAYSFHLSPDCLAQTYQAMYAAYSRIFTRLGLRFRAVNADTGAIGGSASHEFHVLADSGEDAIAVSDGADQYAANLELAPALPPSAPRAAALETLTKVATPGCRTIEQLCSFMNVPATQTLKLLMVEGSEGAVVAILLRGDHELNVIKAQKLPGVATPLRMAAREAVIAATGCEPGYLGPIGLRCPVYADHAAVALADFICGANELDQHYRGVNWQRDLPEPTAVDVRNVVAGDPSPGGNGTLGIRRGIEVGHIFQLGRKYSEAMQASVLDEAGKPVTMYMGCYGIGVTRIVAAAIEQNHDAAGILWPEPLAPFYVVLVPLNAAKSPRVQAMAESLYEQLLARGVEVLLDDRDARPGVKFADAELIGIPHRLVISDRGIDSGNLEYRHRRAADNEAWPVAEVIDRLLARRNTHPRSAP